jgi:hypothetical protein
MESSLKSNQKLGLIAVPELSSLMEQVSDANARAFKAEADARVAQQDLQQRRSLQVLTLQQQLAQSQASLSREQERVAALQKDTRCFVAKIQEQSVRLQQADERTRELSRAYEQQIKRALETSANKVEVGCAAHNESHLAQLPHFAHVHVPLPVPASAPL